MLLALRCMPVLTRVLAAIQHLPTRGSSAFCGQNVCYNNKHLEGKHTDQKFIQQQPTHLQAAVSVWLLYTTLALPLFQYRRSTGRRLRRFTGPQPAEVAYRARKTLLHKCPQPPSPIPDQSNSYQICLVGSKCNCEAFQGPSTPKTTFVAFLTMPHVIAYN